MRLDEARRDLYRRLAKEQGYKSRAAFKLIEACEKYRFIRPGSTVIDFGSAPGGWLQVASELVGEDGLVIGVDKHRIHLGGHNIRTVTSDINDPKLPDKLVGLLGGRADVVLSDLAPDVTGVWELDQGRQADLTIKVLDVSDVVLRRRGAGFFKLFEGGRAQEIRDEFKARFKTVRPIKPAASRSAAAELYYYCEGWGPAPLTAASTSE